MQEHFLNVEPFVALRDLDLHVLDRLIGWVRHAAGCGEQPLLVQDRRRTNWRKPIVIECPCRYWYPQVYHTDLLRVYSMYYIPVRFLLAVSFEWMVASQAGRVAFRTCLLLTVFFQGVRSHLQYFWSSDWTEMKSTASTAKIEKFTNFIFWTNFDLNSNSNDPEE